MCRRDNRNGAHHAEIPAINKVATGTLIAKQFVPPDNKANYIFRTSANDAIQSGVIVDEATSPRGFKAPTTLTDSTNYGQLGRAAAFTRLTGARGRGDVKADLGRMYALFPRLAERRTQLAGTLSGGEQHLPRKAQTPTVLRGSPATRI